MFNNSQKLELKVEIKAEINSKKPKQYEIYYKISEYDNLTSPLARKSNGKSNDRIAVVKINNKKRNRKRKRM
jgi:hypothetical protein